MFRGRFDCKIDDKGRLSLPSAFRHLKSSKKAETFVITNGLFRAYHCLDIYTLNDWQKLEKRIQRLPQLKTEVQAYQRFYLSAGQILELDSQGRLLLPHSLRRFADLESEAVCVGMGEKFEVWPASQWNQLQSQLIEQYDNILNVVADLERGD